MRDSKLTPFMWKLLAVLVLLATFGPFAVAWVTQ